MLPCSLIIAMKKERKSIIKSPNSKWHSCRWGEGASPSDQNCVWVIYYILATSNCFANFDSSLTVNKSCCVLDECNICAVVASFTSLLNDRNKPPITTRHNGPVRKIEMPCAVSTRLWLENVIASSSDRQWIWGYLWWPGTFQEIKLSYNMRTRVCYILPLR